MIEQGTTHRWSAGLFFILLTGTLSGTPIPEDGCWRDSDLTNNVSLGDPECEADEYCVDWNFESAAFGEDPDVISRECCDQRPEFCNNPCVGSYQEGRPGLPIPSILPEESLKDMSNLRHEVPKIPIVIDHAAFAPEEIRRFDGVPLHFLACLMPTGEPLFQAFTTRGGFSEQLQECVLGKPSSVVRGVPVEADSGVVFFDGLGGHGASYFLSSGQSLDLNGTWWDERPSSLRGFGSGTFVTVFENADFSGSSLTLDTKLNWVDLRVFGWDARASAFLVWPAPQVDRKPLLKDDSGQ